MKISALTPDGRNANKGTARGRKVVRESLRKYGAGRSILLDRNGHIIAGNKTVEGATALGMEDVQVVKSDGSKLIAVQRTDLDINDKKARELAIADNRAGELGLEWDTDVLKQFEAEEIDLTPFWDERELVQFFARTGEEAPEPKIDQAAALQAKWGTKLGQLWLIGPHRLLCGDCTNKEAVARLWATSRDFPALLVTDPPYGIEYSPEWRNEHLKEANRAVGRVMNDDRADWREAWALFPGDIAYVWHAGVKAGTVADSLVAAGFEIRAQIIWAKQHFVISRGHYHAQHEPCWYAVRKDKTAKWNGNRAQSTLWEINNGLLQSGGKPADEQPTGHGTQKPIECMQRAINNHLGDVYDPFIGSGTTIIAADRSKRICYGIELEPKYVAVTLQRLFDMGLQPVLADA